VILFFCFSGAETVFQKSLGKISFTTDVWSDSNLASFMATTAHWIEPRTEKHQGVSQIKLALRADLIGFTHIPGRHTGEHLAHALLQVLDRIQITERVDIFSS
jgi:hypothetical protein